MMIINFLAMKLLLQLKGESDMVTDSNDDNSSYKNVSRIAVAISLMTLIVTIKSFL